MIEIFKQKSTHIKNTVKLLHCLKNYLLFHKAKAHLRNFSTVSNNTVYGALSLFRKGLQLWWFFPP